MKPRLFVDQKITAFANKYQVFGANESGEKGQLVAFAQQKRLAFKEKVTFYSDEQKTAAAFTFRAEKVLDVHGRYLVEDVAGALVGAFKKEFKASLLNSTWTIFDASDNARYRVRESNQALAVARRFAGFIPIVGELYEMILLFLRYHFVFEDITTGEVVGKYMKTTLFRDHYQLELTDSAQAEIDWRVWAALGVGLDALQSR